MAETRSAKTRDITDCDDLAKAAREYVDRNPVENVPEKLILHMAAEIESLRREGTAWRRRANTYRRRVNHLERNHG